MLFYQREKGMFDFFVWKKKIINAASRLIIRGRTVFVLVYCIISKCL